MDIFKKIADKFIGLENKPCASNVIYLISGTLGLFSVISAISPLSVSCSLLDKVAMKSLLNNNEPLVRYAFLLSIIYMLVCLIEKICVCIFKDASNQQLRKVYAITYTIEDIVDLFCSIAALTLLVSVFIQGYHTGQLFMSYKAITVYFIVIYKTISLLAAHFKVRNLKIIDRVIENYLDLE